MGIIRTSRGSGWSAKRCSMWLCHPTPQIQSITLKDSIATCPQVACERLLPNARPNRCTMLFAFGPRGRSDFQLRVKDIYGGPRCPNRHIAPFLTRGRLRNNAVDTLVEYTVLLGWPAGKRTTFRKRCKTKIHAKLPHV